MELQLSPRPTLSAFREQSQLQDDASDEATVVPFPSSNENRAQGSLGPSPVRDRTRSRVARSHLAMNTKIYLRPDVSLALPSHGIKMGSHAVPRTPNVDDDLIFQMSPLTSQSPQSVFLSSFEEEEGHMDTYNTAEMTGQRLSTLWENHTSHPSYPPHASHQRTRTNTITQHHRGFSDSIASKVVQTEKRYDHRIKPGSRTVLDLSSCNRAPPSSQTPEPFMYNFPVFESSSLSRARQARALREASKSVLRAPGLGLVQNVDISGKRVESTLGNGVREMPPRHIQSRKPRIQGEEPMCNEGDDSDYISRAFQGVSLEPEKEDMLDEQVDLCVEDDYYSSQRSSSISSESTDDDSYVQSSVPSDSFHTSFSGRASTRSETQSSSNSREERSRSGSRRRVTNLTQTEENAHALLERGRSRRRSAEISLHMTAYAGGDRRGRGRTPPPGRRSGSILL